MTVCCGRPRDAMILGAGVPLWSMGKQEAIKESFALNMRLSAVCVEQD